MCIITISGEMGSRRNQLAQELGERGGLECVDRTTLLTAVRDQAQLTTAEHQLLAEQGPALTEMGNRRLRLFAAWLESVVLEFARRGNVVLVGRGANHLLRKVPGVLRLRTVAPLETRARVLAELEDLSLDRARQLATMVDQQRRAYIAHVFGADWASPLNYDLVMNTGTLSLDQAATTALDLAAHPEYTSRQEALEILEQLHVCALVRRAVMREVEVHALEVETAAPGIRLTGFVASLADCQRAQGLAQEVAGKVAVDNLLEVSPAMARLLP